MFYMILLLINISVLGDVLRAGRCVGFAISFYSQYAI